MTENTTFPRRSVTVWVVLIAVTCATFWLGTDHPFSDVSGRLASALAIVLAFVKVRLIGMDFMEIRQAPRALRFAFTLWLSVIGGGLAILYVL